MILGWFDASEEKAFGKTLAQFYMQKISPDEAKSKKEFNKRKETLEKIFQKMAQFEKEHKLNFYKKAQLGNTFKWELREAGYDDSYIDHLTKELMLMK